MSEPTKATILLVEDEAGFRQIYKDVLVSEGYEVLEAEDGDIGWQLAKEKKPDLILLDLILPKLSGYDVLKNIRAYEETKTIPVLVFSVLENSEDIKKSMLLGANDFIVKGFYEPSHVTEKIKTVLDRVQDKA